MTDRIERMEGLVLLRGLLSRHSVVGIIGAGDSFDEGFHSPVDWKACFCGRRGAGAIRGLNGQPRWEEITPVL